MGDHTNDEQLEGLLDRAIAGDREALVGLLEALGPRVRARIGAKITGPVQTQLDEDDVMQVTYMEAVMRLDRFRSGGVPGFMAWLTRLAENNLIDAIRAMESAKRPSPRRRVGQPRTEESMVALVEVLGVTSGTPSRDAALGEAKTAIEIALAKLPEDYATVIRMYDLEGKTVSEVGGEFGRSEGAVYMLRARAHDRLRDVLGTESRFFSHPR